MHRSLKGTLETILVVDNDEAVRKAVVSILERANFRVLSAHSGVDAINLAEETVGEIHLLLSEVDVPQMSGPDLGQAENDQTGYSRDVDVGAGEWQSFGSQLRLGLHS